MSKISIPGCISDLLFERNQIVLPGLGLFETRDKKSAVDQVQGMIHPPSKEIIFNSNVTGDDGVLVDFIKKKYAVEEMQARTALAEFTNDLRLRVHQKEIVSIPDVGRLYLDFEKNLQFLPDRVNYNKDAFGLPSLNYYPVMKEEAPPPITSKSTTDTTRVVVDNTGQTIPSAKEKTTDFEDKPSDKAGTTSTTEISGSKINMPPVKPRVPETIIPPSPNTPNYPERNSVFVEFLAKAAPFLLVFALFFVAFIFIKFLYNSPIDDLPKDKLAEIEGKLNKKPSFSDDQTSVYEDDEIMDQTNEGMSYDDDDFEDNSRISDNYDDANSMEVEPDTEEDNYEEPARISRGGKSGIIIIGGFSSARNAQKLVEKIQRKGYSPYTDAKGPLTRVGIEFNFNTVSELDDMHRQVKREFNESAWILEPK